MNKKLISLVTMTTIMFTSVSPAFAKNFTSKQNVALTHAWTVKFNKTLGNSQDFSKVTIKDTNGNVVPVSISVGSDNESIIVTPTKSYNSNTNYTLTVDGIKDSDGKALSDNATMQFTTTNDSVNPTPVQGRLPFSLTDSQKSQLDAALTKYKIESQSSASKTITENDILKIVDPDTADYSTLSYTPQPYADTVATNDQLDTWKLDYYCGVFGKTDLSKTAGYYADNVSEACRYEALCWKNGIFQIGDKVDANNNILYKDKCTLDDMFTADPNGADNFKVTNTSNPLLYNQLKSLYSNFFLTKLNDNTNYKYTIMDIPNKVTGQKSGIPAVNFRIDHLPTDEQGMNEGMLETSDVDTLVYLETRKDMLTKYIDTADFENMNGTTVNPNVDMRINNVSQNEFNDGIPYSYARDISNPSQDVLNSIYGQLQALVGKEPATVLYNKYIAYLLIENYSYGSKTMYSLSDPITFNYGSIKVEINSMHIRLWY